MRGVRVYDAFDDPKIGESELRPQFRHALNQKKSLDACTEIVVEFGLKVLICSFQEEL